MSAILEHVSNLREMIGKLERENAQLRSAVGRLRDGVGSPSLEHRDMRKGLYCGVEDRDLQGDGYGAASYGWDDAAERFLEWVKEEADAALAAKGGA